MEAVDDDCHPCAGVWPTRGSLWNDARMSIYTLKPRFQALLRPGVRALHGLGATANQVTVFACALSVALGVWLYLAAPSPAGASQEKAPSISIITTHETAARQRERAQ